MRKNKGAVYPPSFDPALDSCLHDVNFDPDDFSGRQLAFIEKFRRAFADGKIASSPVEKCLCGSRKRKLVARKDRFNLDFNFWLCLDCGIVYTDPQVSPDAVFQVYDEYYLNMNLKTPARNVKSVFSSDQGKKVYDRLSKYISKAELKVLDFGAGPGNVLLDFTRQAKQRGIIVEGLGLELNQTFLQQFRDYGYNLSLQGKSLEDLEDQAGTFDVIICSHILEHIHEPDKTLEMINNLLADDGLLYIEVPGILSLKENPNYRAELNKYLIFVHFYNFSLLPFVSLLNRNGFRCLMANQNIDSVFVKGQQEISFEGNAETVQHYLDDLKISETLYKRNIELAKQFEQTTRDLTGQISQLEQRLNRQAEELKEAQTKLLIREKHHFELKARVGLAEERFIGVERSFARMIPQEEESNQPLEILKPFVLVPRSIPFSLFNRLLRRLAVEQPELEVVILEPNRANLYNYPEACKVVIYQGGRFDADEMAEQLWDLLPWDKCYEIILPVSTCDGKPLEEISRFAGMYPEIKSRVLPAS